MNEKTILMKSLDNVSYQTSKAKLLTMCSEKEMFEREEQMDLNIFEVDPLISPDYMNKRVKKEFAVKRYTRSAAEKIMDNPDNIRPPEVLTKTLNYLLNEIVDIDTEKEISRRHFKKDSQENYTFTDITLFVEDRFRSIKQDFVILDLKGNKDCIICHEKIARFLILCLNEGLDHDAFVGLQSLFKLFYQQLNATLTSLREFYEYVEQNVGDSSHSLYESENIGEFVAYSIILSFTENFDLISMLNKIPKRAKFSKKIKFAKKVARAFLAKEYITYFKLLKEADYLTACLMSLYLKEMRISGLETIRCRRNSDNIDKTSFKFTVNELTDFFLFEDYEELDKFLDWYGVDTDNLFENEDYDR